MHVSPQFTCKSIIIADDHPVFREAMAALTAGLYPDAKIAEAGTFTEMLEAAHAAATPDLFILDLWFPGMDISHSIAQLRGAFPNASIVIVSMADDHATITKVMAAGVDGFISKALTSEQMRNAFIKLAQGEFVAIGGGAEIAPKETLHARFPDLTARQREVLQHVCEGRSNKEIGRILEISPLTVRTHVSSLLRALGVETRSALVGVASRFGG
jgi:DNA-binding NarL/FixJ family response regulator